MPVSSQQEWDEIASQDAEWAILSTSETKHGGWDRDAFFATGRRDVDAVVQRAEGLGLAATDCAMDFGCGLGRLTRPLADRFGEVVGVDVSGEMVRKASALHAAEGHRLRFVVEAGPRLSSLGDDSFDLVLTRLVLQHLPGRAAVDTMLSEFIRVLRPGGIVTLQLPAGLTRLQRMQPRRTAYRILRSIGVPPAVLYGRLGLHPMSMLAIPVDRTTAILEQAGGRVVAVDQQRDPEHGYADAVYWVTK
jgi:SAM-dependent methyltransferase